MNEEKIVIDRPTTVSDLEILKRDLLTEIKQLVGGNVQNKRKQWLRSGDVRKMLRISAGTLQNLRLNGSLPYSKIGGIVFYEYEEIEKLLETNGPNHKKWKR